MVSLGHEQVSPESEIEVADIAPTAPDWVLAGCEDGSVFGCSGDGSQCLGLIDSIDLTTVTQDTGNRPQRTLLH